MTGEEDPRERSLAVSRLAHAATRVVATRRAEAADATGVDKAKANRAFYEFLREMDAELDDHERWRSDPIMVDGAGQGEEEVEGGGGR